MFSSLKALTQQAFENKKESLLNLNSTLLAAWNSNYRLRSILLQKCGAEI